MPEARLEDTGSGLAPGDDGWFVVNVSEAMWLTFDSRGSLCVFQSLDAWAYGSDDPEFSFRQLGINLTVLEPGQRNGIYHAESPQEAFLVLSGECRLLVEDEERILRAWDFFHCPGGTAHIFVGAGDGPCVILMAGARSDDERVVYPVSALAARYGASVQEQTSDPDEAYAGSERARLARPASWDRLPWTEQRAGDRP
jgi:uncharacterized cupin superfamily protein